MLNRQRVGKDYRARGVMLLIMLILICITVLLVTLVSLFRAVSYQNQYMLSSFVNNQALLFEKMIYEEPDWNKIPRQVLLNKVYSKFRRQAMPTIVEAGEFEVVARFGNRIHYYTDRSGHKTDMDYDQLSDQATEVALQGGAGLMRDESQLVRTVIAFTSLPKFDLAFVIRVRAKELVQPFIEAAISAILSSVFLICIGGWLFYRLSRPIILRLEENEVKYRTLFENVNEGVLLMSSYVEELNGRAGAILGYTKDEIKGRHLFDFSSSEWSLPDEVLLFEQARRNIPQRFIWRPVKADSTVLDVEVTLRRIIVDERVMTLVTLLDITERVKAEQELRVAEQRIRDGRDHIAHMGRLTTMGEMAAGIAHEINQPLSAITTYSQGATKLLKRDPVDYPLVAEALEQVSRQSKRAGEVIKRLRSFVGKTEGKRELLSPTELIEDVVALGSVDAQKVDIPVITQIEDGLPELELDRVQLQQVLLNLMRNGLEAMDESPSKAHKLLIESRLIESCNSVLIAVKDTGPGLSEDALDRVFHPFFTTKKSGMGIGLSLSQSIVQGQGGALTVRNRNEQGAVFEVWLPYVK